MNTAALSLRRLSRNSSFAPISLLRSSSPGNAISWPTVKMRGVAPSDVKPVAACAYKNMSVVQLEVDAELPIRARIAEQERHVRAIERGPVIEAIGLRFVGIPQSARQAKALGEVERDVHERGLVVRRIEIVRDEVRERPAVVERFELRRVVGTALRLEEEQARGPAEAIARTDSSAEIQLDLLLVVVLNVVRLSKAERRSVAVVGPLAVVAALRDDELGANVVGELVVEHQRHAARIHDGVARIGLAVHDVGERRVVRVRVAGSGNADRPGHSGCRIS